MRKTILMLVLSATAWHQPAAAREPILDMHLHARTAKYAGDNPPPMCAPFEIMPRAATGDGTLIFNGQPCERPIFPEATDAAVLSETLAAMEKYNIIGVVSGGPELVAEWRAAAPNRIIPALDFRLAGTTGQRHVAARSIDDLRRLRREGRFAVLGEIMAQYEGVAVNDPRMEPFWALAEELDIPVAIHMGPGEPGQPYHGSYRAALGNPLLLEEVLVRHPRLRVSIMHAGYPFADALRALMFSHPQVYAEIGGIIYTEPRPAFYAFLKEIVEAGYGDRILFGSDQMIWPGIIGHSVEVIRQAPFLSPEQKRDILYNNAARFLRLSKEEVARHHAM